MIFFALGAVSVAVAAYRGAEARVDVVSLDTATVDATRRRLQQELRRPPSEEELRAATRSLVDQEILFREALTLGLDRTDPIVRRRMIQKMTMILEGQLVPEEIDDAAVAAWFEAHRARFVIPERRSFVHMQLGDVTDAELQVLVREASGLSPEEIAQGVAASASSIHGPTQRALSHDEAKRRFGAGVADEVFGQTPGRWAAARGPQGWVLIRVDAVLEARVPSLDEVRAQAREGWRASQREGSLRRGMDELRSRYDVRGMP